MSGRAVPNGTTVTYTLLAYERGNDANEVTRRGIPPFRLDEAVRWALTHGRNTVLIEAGDARPSSTTLTTHHVCQDPWCPGGCDQD